MYVFSSRIASRTCQFALGLFVGVAISACIPGDVGAPCNHGPLDLPSKQAVTFPALSCNELLCVYGVDDAIPPENCTNDDDCNRNPEIGKRFSCNDKNTCELDLAYVLRQSMCSKRCDNDADCNNSAVKKNVAKETQCNKGFVCAILQKLGDLCCEKICVCEDHLNTGTSSAQSKKECVATSDDCNKIF